jgi:hypothetical protein
MVVGSDNAVLAQCETGSGRNVPLRTFTALVKSPDSEYGSLATGIKLIGMYAFKLGFRKLNGSCSPIQLSA